jgi:hypothetical protein
MVSYVFPYITAVLELQLDQLYTSGIQPLSDERPGSLFNEFIQEPGEDGKAMHCCMKDVEC